MLELTSYMYLFFFHWISGKLYPPQDVRIHVIGSTAKISWTIPTNIQEPEWSRIFINTSTGGDIDLDPRSKFDFKDIGVPKSSFEINNLKICSEYIVRIRFISAKSEFTSKKFWMTSKFSFPKIQPSY